MELDDLKRSWEQYDKKLTENLKMNEELLRRSNLDRSKRTMNTPLIYISIGVVLSAVFTLLLFRWTLICLGEPLYLICGCICMLYTLFNLVYGMKELGMLRNMDYYNAPVLELQKQLSTFKAFYNKMKKIDFYIMPVAILAAMPLVFRVIHHLNIFNYPKMFIFTLLIGLAIAYPGLIWVYRNWYDKKVKAADRFLSELQEFEKE